MSSARNEPSSILMESQAACDMPAESEIPEACIHECECSLGDLFGVYLKEAVALGVRIQPSDLDAKIFDSHHLEQELSKPEATQLDLPELKRTALGDNEQTERLNSTSYNEFGPEKKSSPGNKLTGKKIKKTKKTKLKKFELPAGSGDKWSLIDTAFVKTAASSPPGGKSKDQQLRDSKSAKGKKNGRRAMSSKQNRLRGGVALREANGDEQLARDRRMLQSWLRKMEIFRTEAYSLQVNGSRTSTGWNGRNPPPATRSEIRGAYFSGRIKAIISTFFPVHADLLRPTVLLDSQSRAFFYRTAQAHWLKERRLEFNNAVTKLLQPMLECPETRAKYATAERGPHLPLIMGHDRQYTDKPKLTAWHREHETEVLEFIETPVIQDITTWICRVVLLVFPGVAARFTRSAEWHKERYGIIPLFGFFWNLCINGIFEGQRRVHSFPHADSKNNVGLCVLLIYEQLGKKFNHSKRTWIVLWEAGVAIQLPPWVMAAYPSSLFYHFNIDICDFKFVTTDGDERPTPENSTPLEPGDDEGRGSLVYFNQATMYQSSETNSATLADAIVAGHSGKTDYPQCVQEAFVNFGIYVNIRPQS